MPSFKLQHPIAQCSSLVLGLSTLLGVLPMFTPQTKAVELLDGSTAFEQIPQLQHASTSENRTSARNPVYTFTIDLPADAGEPLGRLTIRQRDQRYARLRYRLEASQAYGQSNDGTPVALPLAAVNQDPDTQAITFEFAEPVSPGQEIRISLHPMRNPRWGNTYLFGVTATPAATQAQSQFIGYGRIRIYDADPLLGWPTHR